MSGLPGLALATPATLHVEPTGIGALPVRLTLPAEAAAGLEGRSSPIVFEIRAEVDGKLRTAREKSTFFVPR